MLVAMTVDGVLIQSNANKSRNQLVVWWLNASANGVMRWTVKDFKCDGPT